MSPRSFSCVRRIRRAPRFSSTDHSFVVCSVLRPCSIDLAPQRSWELGLQPRLSICTRASMDYCSLSHLPARSFTRTRCRFSSFSVFGLLRFPLTASWTELVLDVAHECDGSCRCGLVDQQDFEDKVALVERWVQSTVVEWSFPKDWEKERRLDP
mmetsp:Transcript_25157/g.65926  ORF Transcript_25157/g.65926 Transcript_25157/m.65926 type:complete len:155 (+) Transcript_25157:1027-1491(+)